MIAIAIDGPSGAGKSTLAKAIAARMGIVYVDTGALYRTVGYAVCAAGADPKDAKAVIALLPSVRVDVRYENETQAVYLNGANLGDRIRTPEISAAASAVSKIPEVRDFLLSAQKTIAAHNDVIMDGRDIGTVILPHADAKIFLTADAAARARRRTAELREKGQDVRYENILCDMEERDRQDETREVAPAVAAPDAVCFDNSALTREESVEAAIAIIREKLEKTGKILGKGGSRL